MTATYVACLDAETGALRWIRYLGAASSDADNMMGGDGHGLRLRRRRLGHRLLTLDGPTLYYQTNLGAVAALDAETGAIRWVATYPRAGPRPTGQPGRERDLNPAVVHDGLVIVAPDDAAAIFAFDAASGRLVWKTDPIPEEVKLAHLLGVAKGRLIATGDRVLLFDVKTGKLVHTWPDSGRAYEGFGRGLLAGDKIYWPTRTEIHVLDQATGLPRRAADQAPGVVPDDRRQPRRRRRLPDRRPDRRAGRLLPEQPADPALPRGDRHGPRAGVELLPAGPGGRGDRPGRAGPGVARRRPCGRPGRPRRSTACRWSTRPATTSSGC